MTHHHPAPTEQLKMFQALLGRMYFSKEAYRTYHNDFKGFLGEKYFSQMISKELKIPFLALYSLFYEENGNYFQPDCLLFISNQLHLLEIKNYEGEFMYQDEYLYCYSAKKKYRNPVDQVNRGKLLLQNMLHRLNIPLELHVHVIFVNPSFTLFQAKKNPYIILPTQLKAYLKNLNNRGKHLPMESQTYSRQLLSQHRSKSPFTKVPNYTNETLQRGIFCHICRCPMIKKSRKKLSCHSCSYVESLDSGILRNVLEYRLLFPDKKITTGMINQWCGNIVTDRTMNRILTHYFTPVSFGRGAHYLLK